MPSQDAKWLDRFVRRLGKAMMHNATDLFQDSEEAGKTLPKAPDMKKQKARKVS